MKMWLVSRFSVSSYDDDVAAFIASHPDFYADDDKMSYMRAKVNVGDIRQTEVRVGDVLLDIDVEVEPRDVFTKSHAGIFAHHDGKNIKVGDTLCFHAVGKEVSSDEVLLEIRSHFLDIATLEKCLIRKESII